MKIKEIISALDTLAPFSLQEEYDNAGLTTGHPEAEVHACLVCLDVTEDVIEEALKYQCDMIISHHPVIFKGIKRLTGRTMTERIVEKAIRGNIALCSIHTNLDNIEQGVNRKFCEKLGLHNTKILRKTGGVLRKLVTFCPVEYAERVREAIFKAGAGHIGEYEQCSFNAEGLGSFRAGDKADPFVGKKGELHFEKETRIETIYPVYREAQVVSALLEAHPYEEVAYDLYPLANDFSLAGAGMTGELVEEQNETDFLARVKSVLNIPVIRHSALTGKTVKRVAVCGGAGSFLIQDAIRSEAEMFITADIKYHQFFDAEGRIVIVDAGHFETEQFTCEILADYLKKKFTNFAVRISETLVNPVNYF